MRKSLNFCEKINMKVVGIVENMSGYACPHCGKDLPLFKRRRRRKDRQAANVPFLGALPFDPAVVEAVTRALLDVKEADSPFLQAFKPIVDHILETLPLTRWSPGSLG